MPLLESFAVKSQVESSLTFSFEVFCLASDEPTREKSNGQTATGHRTAVRERARGEGGNLDIPLGHPTIYVGLRQRRYEISSQTLRGRLLCTLGDEEGEGNGGGGVTKIRRLISPLSRRVLAGLAQLHS